MRKKILPYLAAAIFALGIATFAVDRTVPAGLEGNFAFLFAFRADRLVKFSGTPTTEPASATTFSVETHIISLILGPFRAGHQYSLAPITCLIS
ncbi:MAG: hypothetical protein A2705_02825 [Omnitrophica WOR_2 bacterium RIFCSPHIGHO2_01_FULL_52_10]|nr:MAG: hypothetical protein A2705_02825 [Omnitrophica WOR_2 bacterium RIFCSPHIGHO2_01_FULL_52_10]